MCYRGWKGSRRSSYEEPEMQDTPPCRQQTEY
nr:MAG TPA: hypothetical protein [Caudoviricetes sp.]